ncbi:MAG: hypothetical protein GX489_00590 [Firmicutes bacterium]|nr:hypothetical protein [Bacillota bacterium]
MLNNRAGQETQVREDELVSGIAHEIKNPLASIQGFLQLLARRVEEDTTALYYVHMIISELNRLQELVEDYLCFGCIKVAPVTVCDPGEIVDNVVALSQAEAARRGIKIAVKKSLCPRIEAAPKLLQQLLWNLMTNALAALSNGGMITLELRLADDNWLQIICRDTGTGIPPAVLPQIFRPYFTTKEDGTGLGLPISQRIAEFHGGRLEVESKLGSGTTFILWLPLKQGIRE